MKRRRITQEQVDRANRIRMLFDGDGIRRDECQTCDYPPPVDRWVLVDGRPMLLPKDELDRLR